MCIIEIIVMFCVSGIMVNGHGHGNGYNQDIGMAKIMVTVRIIVKILLIIIVMGRIIKLVTLKLMGIF